MASFKRMPILHAIRHCGRVNSHYEDIAIQIEFFVDLGRLQLIITLQALLNH